jgi:hypothetical protein
MMPNVSADRFLDDVLRILRDDRKLRKRPSECRALAHQLAPVLFRAAIRAREMRQEWDQQGSLTAIRSHVAPANALAQNARELLQLLDRSAPHIRNAVREGLLRRHMAAPMARSLSDLAKRSDDDWAAERDIRQALQRLAREAADWASRAGEVARLPRGRRRSKTRDRLSAWVAIQLARVGIRPTAAKGGTFARVLAITQATGGFSERSLEQMERDIRRALMYPSVSEEIAKIT